MTPTLTLTRGLPASGKTTFALAQLEAAEPGALSRVNRDSLRRMLHGQARYGHVTEQQVTAAARSTIRELLTARVDVICDDTNLRARHLRTLAGIGWAAGAEVVVRDFTDVTPDECVRRDAARGPDARVGEQVIRDMHARYLAGHTLPLPVPERPDTAAGEWYTPDPRLPAAVMVDIDGTVALHGDRSPYDTSRYHEDTPNQAVIASVRCMTLAGYRPVFCSGRDEEHRAVTQEWLDRHVALPGPLFMRPAGDRRRDDVVKLELFDTHIRHTYRVVCAYDDRDRVVAAWRSIGLTVMQVAPGDF